MKSPQEVAKLFGIPVAQAREIQVKNRSLLLGYLQKVRQTGKCYRGYTDAKLCALIQQYNAVLA